MAKHRLLIEIDTDDLSAATHDEQVSEFENAIEQCAADLYVASEGIDHEFSVQMRVIHSIQVERRHTSLLRDLTPSEYSHYYDDWME